MNAPFKMSRVGQHAAIYGAGILLSKVVSFVMLPVYTRYLTPADYGVMQLVEMTLDVISIVAGTRLSAGIFRFWHKTDDPERQRDVVGTSLILLASSYAIVSIGTFFLASWLSTLVLGSTKYAVLVRIAAGSLAAQSVTLVGLAYVRIEERSRFFVVLNAVKLFIQAGLNLVLIVGLHWGVKGAFVSTLVASIVMALWLGVYLVQRIGVRFTRGAALDLIRFGYPLIAVQVAMFIVTYGDRYFLRAASNVATVGLYALAYQFGFLLSTIGATPFGMVWEPARFQIAKRDDRHELFARAFVYLNVLLMTMAMGIALYVGDFIRVASDPTFRGATHLVSIILVAYVLQSWSSFFEVGILVRERTGYITLANWAAALVALAGYVLLIPRWLGVGAAAATVLAFAVRTVVTYVASQRLWHLHYEWGPIARLVGWSGVIYFLASLLPPTERLWTSLPLRTALYAVYLLGVWRLGVLTDWERRRIWGVVSSPRTAIARLAAGG